MGRNVQELENNWKQNQKRTGAKKLSQDLNWQLASNTFIKDNKKENKKISKSFLFGIWLRYFRLKSWLKSYLIVLSSMQRYAKNLIHLFWLSLVLNLDKKKLIYKYIKGHLLSAYFNPVCVWRRIDKTKYKQKLKNLI